MTVQSLVTNYRTILTEKYFCVEGRAGRAEFWQWVLIIFIINSTLGIVGGFFGMRWILTGAFLLAMLLPGIGVGTRRLHDVGRSGWWQLLGFTGIGFFIFFIMCIPKGDAGENRYGAPVGTEEIRKQG